MKNRKIDYWWCFYRRRCTRCRKPMNRNRGFKKLCKKCSDYIVNRNRLRRAKNAELDK